MSMLELRFTETRFENGWLCLKPENKPLAYRFAHGFPNGTSHTAKIAITRRKRSLDANAYFWALCDQLAAATGLRKDEVYLDLVQNVGGNTELLPIRRDAVARFVEAWQRNGLGWLCVRTGTSKLDGYENVIAYYGSSTYDSRQMARLIDLAVQECRALEIETLPPDKLDAMKAAWQGGAA